MVGCEGCEDGRVREGRGQSLEATGAVPCTMGLGACTLPSEPQLNSSPYGLWENCKPHTSAPRRRGAPAPREYCEWASLVRGTAGSDVPPIPVLSRSYPGPVLGALPLTPPPLAAPPPTAPSALSHG